MEIHEARTRQKLETIKGHYFQDGEVSEKPI